MAGRPLSVPLEVEFLFMSQPKCNVCEAQWRDAADRFELGIKNGKQLADELGVSPQTVMRQMKLMGAVKGSRAHETVVDLNAFLDLRDRRKAHARMLAETLAAERRAAGLAILNEMMKAIVDADGTGDLTCANEVVAVAAAALGARVSKR